MKLKLFSKLLGSAANATGVKLPKAEEQAPETTEETPETPEEPEETEEEPEETPEEEPEANTSPPVGLSEAVSSLVQAMGELGNVVEAQGRVIDQQQKDIAQLRGDRTEEIQQEASRRAVTMTASQGVPADEMPEGGGEPSAEAPKNSQEFWARYNAIEDSAQRGRYFSKYHGNFGQK